MEKALPITRALRAYCGPYFVGANVEAACRMDAPSSYYLNGAEIHINGGQHV
jgi:hypothetical protein